MAYKYAGLFSQPIIDSRTGRVLPTTPVTVYTDSGLTTLASLYTSRTKAVADTNPTYSDAYGNLNIYADPGQYYLVYNGVTVPIMVPVDATEARFGERRQHDFGIASPVIAETVPRSSCSANLSVLTTQIVQLQAIELPPNQTVTTITYISGATAIVNATNWWFVLCDKNLVVKAVTADQLTTAWGTNTVKSLAVGTPYVTPNEADLYYVGIMVKAATVPTLRGPVAMGNAIMATAFTPTLCGASSTGQTTPPALAATLTAITGGVNYPYAAVS